MEQLKCSKLRMSLLVCLWCCFFLIDAADTKQTDPNEVKALRKVKNILVDPFKNLGGWNKGDPCTSNWTGVFCYNGTLDDGYFHVRELALNNKNLTGSLSPEIGRLSYLQILDFMWNGLTGSIPKEIGNIKPLELLLLNGNNLTGSLPNELGNLSNMNRIQIDQNFISGPIPASFANLSKAKHFHMNNNSLSGTIPPELSRLSELVHVLLDNNNLSGPLPPELSQMPKLFILQLDNNNFEGSTIPPSYGNITSMLKLSLRNCNLQGSIPDFSNSPNLSYIDLSGNQLSGPVSLGALSVNITTIDLSRNNLSGTIPASFSGLPILQKLSVANNSFNGSVPSSIWKNRTLNSTERMILDFGFNRFSSVDGLLPAPFQNITIGLRGNPVCPTGNLVQFCGSHNEDFNIPINFTSSCPPEACPAPFEYAPPSPATQCFCAAPVRVGYRLKSPGFSDFLPYVDSFKEYLSSGLEMNATQLDFDSVAWQRGPRLRMYLKIFPAYVNDSVRLFNDSDVSRIREMFGGWRIPESPIFGPYEFLNFTLSELYERRNPSPSLGLSKGALAGIILGTIAVSVTISALVSLVLMRRHIKKNHATGKRRPSSKISIRLDGVKDFTYKDLALATNDFSDSTVVGSGGYGKVHRGVLADGMVVAIKRAEEGSLQGEKEFLTEIELLSRLHHRNLVSLIGYCDEEGEQMLVYEFMPNGSLRDHLSGKTKSAMSFATRIKMALGSSRGILYLHTEANPPIFHRDIKATNILLDSRFTAKVSDFGLSKLAPAPEMEGALPCHVSTVVKGTPGYLDPEYFLTHKLTDKSDVYSLGVVFLEMLTGMHPISHGKNIVREVNIAYRSGMIFSIIDDRMGSYPSECVEKFINLALKCCHEQTDARPSMSEVYREVESIWLMLPESDTHATESPMSGSSALGTTLSQSRNPFVSQDVSGSDLVSGVVHSIAPR